MNREEMILSLEKEVQIQAREIYRSLTYKVRSEEDLKSAGWVGAIKAVDKFDSSKGFKLNSFAKFRIRGSILDYLRETDPLTKEHRRDLRAGKAEKVKWCSTYRESGEPREIEAPKPPCPSYGVDIRKLLKTATLSKRELEVLRLRYFDDLWHKDIARELGISKTRVGQIINESLEKLRSVS